MTNDIERHSPDEWRKTAAALMSESVAVGAGETTAKVNANGAPLLGDSRDLFRPKTSDIPAKPGVYKWRDGEGRVIYVGKAKNLRNRLTNYFQPLYLLHPRTQTMVLTARSLEWTVVATELESLTLEYTWIKEEVLKAKFGALYNAFQFGAPPHAGMAPGVDRMIMLLRNEENIREVIPFPMSGTAQDLMCGAPNEVTEQQLREVHIKVRD